MFSALSAPLTLNFVVSVPFVVSKLLKLLLHWSLLSSSHVLTTVTHSSGCPRSLVLRLQKVQNNAVRLILRIAKREHISPHLASLHWLPIDSRIKYKLACICYNSMSTNSPPYLSDLLTVYTASRQLLSCSDNSVLRRPSVRTVSYGQRYFAYSALSAWNALPQQVRSSDSVSTFRSRTKTHLSRLAY